MVPPFRAASRDRAAAELDLVWRPQPPLTLWASADVLRDRSVAGDVVSGPGDLRLGASADVWTARGPASPTLGLGWEAKVPSARDEGELGTDETDVSLWGALDVLAGPVRLAARGGVAILGDPLQFANQDDVALAWLTAWAPTGPVSLGGRVGGTLRSPRNPARLSASALAASRGRVRIGAEATAGLTPAAADWAARLGVGVGWACPAGTRD